VRTGDGAVDKQDRQDNTHQNGRHQEEEHRADAAVGLIRIFLVVADIIINKARLPVAFLVALQDTAPPPIAPILASPLQPARAASRVGRRTTKGEPAPRGGLGASSTNSAHASLVSLPSFAGALATSGHFDLVQALGAGEVDLEGVHAGVVLNDLLDGFEARGAAFGGVGEVAEVRVEGGRVRGLVGGGGGDHAVEVSAKVRLALLPEEELGVGSQVAGLVVVVCGSARARETASGRAHGDDWGRGGRD
jgi:hypothetical protein